MDSDSEGSLNDFRDPKDFTGQEKPLPARRGGVKIQPVRGTGKNSRLLRSFKGFGRQELSGKKASEAKRRAISPVQKKLAKEKKVYSQEVASPSLLNKREFSRCPTCGQVFRILEIIQHASACLRENFEVCKVRHDCVKDGLQRRKCEEKHGSDCKASLHDKSFSTVLRDGDSSKHSMEQKNSHIGASIDHFSRNVPNKQGQTRSEKKLGQTVNCPFCLKALTSRGLKRHLVACQKKQKFSAVSAMVLNQPEMEDVDNNLLAGIRKCGEKASVSTRRKRHLKSKKKANKKGAERYCDETLKLALAVSNAENLRKQEPTGMKKKKEIVFPVMIALSPNSKRQQLKSRLHNIAHSEHSFVGEDIPNTPVLPATSLSLSNVKVISDLQSNRVLDEDTTPGTSGLFSPQADRCTGSSPTSSATLADHSAPCKPCGNELQSPEVSSSNMKNSVSCESSEIPVVAGLENVDITHRRSEVRQGNRKSFTQKSTCFCPQPAKWNFSKSSRESKPLYHVPGLLSQFDERKKNILAALTEPNDEMNSTLFALSTLDKDYDDSDKGSVVGEKECGAFDLSAVARPSFPHEKRSILSQPVAPFVKLIDNPQFSDARILAGQKEEVIYLHKNILFCWCPLLLEEIISCDNDELRLKKYDKSTILPLIDYIYSRRIEPLLAAIDSNRFSKTTELMKKFDVSVTHSQRQMLNAALKDQAIRKLSSVKTFDKDIQPQCVSPIQDENSCQLFESLEDTPFNSADLTSSIDQQHQEQNGNACFKRISPVPETGSGIVRDELRSKVCVKTSPSSAPMPKIMTKRVKRVFVSPPNSKKRRRRVPSVRKRHSNWRTRRCSCCTQNDVETGDKESKVVHNCSASEKQSHRKRRSYPLYQSRLRKKIRLQSPGRRMNLPSSAEAESVSFNDAATETGHLAPRAHSADSECTQVIANEKASARPMGESEVSAASDIDLEVSSQILHSSGAHHIDTQVSKPSHCDHMAKTGDEIHHENVAPMQEKSSVVKAQVEDELHRYVTERLPRLKQRDYIKNRPGVANMGKASNKGGKVVKKIAPISAKAEFDFEVNKIEQSALSKTETQSDFHFDEEIVDKFSECKSLSVALSSYACPSPLKSDLQSPRKIFKKLDHVLERPSAQWEYPSKPDFFVSHSKHFQSKLSRYPSNSVLITPMPNFKVMSTPELLQRAKDIGLKHKIGKPRIRVKLEEAFRYQHQLYAEVNSILKEADGDGNQSADEDDLRISNVDEKNKKLRLSDMSASSNINESMKSIYSFSALAKDEVLDLSTAVVDAMHLDGSLLKALQEMEEKTGSIKRGSQQDRRRCWDMVTPGSSGYNVKLDAILRLPEDYITSITAPFVACVVKYYIQFKKYQFDCLPAVCDRMEEWHRLAKEADEKNILHS